MDKSELPTPPNVNPAQTVIPTPTHTSTTSNPGAQSTDLAYRPGQTGSAPVPEPIAIVPPQPSAMASTVSSTVPKPGQTVPRPRPKEAGSGSGSESQTRLGSQSSDIQPAKSQSPSQSQSRPTNPNPNPNPKPAQVQTATQIILASSKSASVATSSSSRPQTPTGAQAPGTLSESTLKAIPNKRQSAALSPNNVSDIPIKSPHHVIHTSSTPFLSSHIPFTYPSLSSARITSHARVVHPLLLGLPLVQEPLTLLSHVYIPFTSRSISTARLRSRPLLYLQSLAS